MYSYSDDKEKADKELLEMLIRNYKNYKSYVKEATEEEKQTPRYQHRKLIVEGVDELYHTLTNDMKRIFDMRYKQNIEDFADIADEIFVTTVKVKRLRDVITNRFAEIIGWV